MKTPYANSAFWNLSAGEKNSPPAKIVPIQKPARNAKNLTGSEMDFAGGEKQSSQSIFPEKYLAGGEICDPKSKISSFDPKNTPFNPRSINRLRENEGERLGS